MSICPLVFEGCTACSNTSTPKFSFAKQKNGNFLKSLQFSPDGAFTLAATEDNYALIGSLNPDTIKQHTYYTSSLNAEDPDYYDEKDQISSVPIGEAIYDLKWYPPHNQGAKCFVSTSRDHPIVLWDASSCEEDAIIRCTYRGYDPADELEAAISLCFNLAGDKLYAGANRTIR